MCKHVSKHYSYVSFISQHSGLLNLTIEALGGCGQLNRPKLKSLYILYFGESPTPILLLWKKLNTYEVSSISCTPSPTMGPIGSPTKVLTPHTCPVLSISTATS